MLECIIQFSTRTCTITPSLKSTIPLPYHFIYTALLLTLPQYIYISPFVFYVFCIYASASACLSLPVHYCLPAIKFLSAPMWLVRQHKVPVLCDPTRV